MIKRALFVIAIAVLHAIPISAAELSVWMVQSDLRTTLGVPESLVSPSSIAYNPVTGKLAILCGGSNGAVLEWDKGE